MMPLYEPSAGLTASLRSFDASLRLRWSDGQGCWRLERRVSRGQPWAPSVLDTASAYEDRHAHHEGYVLVGLIDKNDLDDRLLPILRRADIWSRGGPDVIADEMDKLDADHRRLMRAALADDMEAMARERWRYMNRPRTVSEAQAHTAPKGGMSIND